MKKKAIKRKAGSVRIIGTVWPYDVVVSLGTTEAEFIAYMSKNFTNALTENDKKKLKFDGALGRVIRFENNALLLWTKEFPLTSKSYGVLVHEIFHAADCILDRAGMVHSNDSDEAWAYLIEWITIQIYNRFDLCPKGAR